MQVDSFFIDQTKFGQGFCAMIRAGETSISPSRSALSLRIAPSRSSSTSLALRTDRLQQERDDPFQLVPPRGREQLCEVSIPFRMIKSSQ